MNRRRSLVKAQPACVGMPMRACCVGNRMVNSHPILCIGCGSSSSRGAAASATNTWRRRSPVKAIFSGAATNWSPPVSDATVNLIDVASELGLDDAMITDLGEFLD